MNEVYCRLKYEVADQEDEEYERLLYLPIRAREITESEITESEITDNKYLSHCALAPSATTVRNVAKYTTRVKGKEQL